jgi:hypothetical protein
MMGITKCERHHSKGKKSKLASGIENMMNLQVGIAGLTETNTE